MAEFACAAPPEVYKIFPDFKNELRDLVMSCTAEQLQMARQNIAEEAAGVEDATGHNYALRAFHAALEVHAVWSRAGAAAAAAATFVADFGTFHPDLKPPPTQVEELLENPPPELRTAFPEFDLELRQMLQQPIDTIRTTVARLEQALADVLEARCFNESTGAVDASAPSHELQALALDYSVRTMNAAIVEMEALSDVNGMRDLALTTEMPAEIGTPQHRAPQQHVPPPPLNLAAIGDSLAPACPAADDDCGTSGAAGAGGAPWNPLGSPVMPHELGEIGALLPMAMEELDRFRLSVGGEHAAHGVGAAGGSGLGSPAAARPPLSPRAPLVHHLLWAETAARVSDLVASGATGGTGGTGGTEGSGASTGGSGGGGGSGGCTASADDDISLLKRSGSAKRSVARPAPRDLDLVDDDDEMGLGLPPLCAMGQQQQQHEPTSLVGGGEMMEMMAY